MIFTKVEGQLLPHQLPHVVYTFLWQCFKLLPRILPQSNDLHIISSHEEQGSEELALQPPSPPFLGIAQQSSKVGVEPRNVPLQASPS